MLEANGEGAEMFQGAEGEEGRKDSSFLKKRSKKLLLVASGVSLHYATHAARNGQKFSGSFFQKRTSCRTALCLLPAIAYYGAMDGTTLPPELARFAEAAVAAGRYRDLSEVVAAGVSLLQDQEAERAAFVRSLEEAEAEGEREGFLPIDEVCRDLDGLIEELDRSRA